MDFRLSQTIAAVVGVLGASFTITSVVKAVFDSPMRKAKAEIMKSRALGELRDREVDAEILSGIRNLELLVTNQSDEIRRLSEENDFFRKLLTDKTEAQGKS
jgi:hypothetical protein